MALVPISGSLSRRFVQSNINILRGDPHQLPVVDTVRGCWAQERHAAIFETGSGTAVNLGISGNSHSDCFLSSSIKTAIIGRNEGPTDCIQTSSLPRTAGSHLNAFHKGMLPRQHFSGPVAPSLCCRKTITTLIADYNNRPSPTWNRSPIWILQDHMEHEWAFNRSLYFPRCNFRPLAANTAVCFDCGSFCKSPLKSSFTRSRRVAAMAVVNFRKSFRNSCTAKYPRAVFAVTLSIRMIVNLIRRM